MKYPQNKTTVKTSLAPWLTVSNSIKALAFYKNAFGAIEKYRLDVPGGVVAKLSIDGAEFWISDGAKKAEGKPKEDLGGGSVRMILTVADPDNAMTRALAAGATEIYPVGENHGWRLGRIVDPFGLHWEIGHEV
jgi:PhnB protein